MEFKDLPKDILSPIFSLVDPEDLVWIGLCGDKKFMERLAREGLVSSMTLTDLSGSSFPFSALSTPAFSSLTRIVIHYESDISSWLWDPCFLPSTLLEIDFSFENAFEVFLQPLRDVNNPHWMLQPTYGNHQTPSEQSFTPILLCYLFPKLEKLRISGSLFSEKWGFPIHWGVKRPYRDLQNPTFDASINWTQPMLRRFLKKLPTSLTSLDLSISADALEKVPELPPNLTSLRYCEGVAPATHTPRFWLKLPETHRPDLSSLPNFQWDYYSRKISVAADKFASEIGLFNNIRSLDISNVQLRSVADLKLIPRYLTHLKFNFHHSYRRGTLSMSDVSILPRTITHLTLLQCPWVNSKNSNENANNFCSLLPPNLTYFYLGDLNGLWNFSIAFSEMRSSLKHLQTLIIDTPLLELHTFDPWLPCDTLHTLEILANEGCLYVHRDLFSSWPTEIPNNIKRLKFSLSYYGGDAEPYEDDNLQKLPPHLTSLTLDGRCFRISPSFFGSLPKSVTFLELSTSFTHQEEEEEFYYDDCLKDTVIVRHCPQHIELHMNYIFTGAFLPSNLTKLTTDHGPILEVIPRPQLPSQLRYCNLSYVKLDSNCIIPDTLTELDFGSDPIDLALVSKSPNLQRLTGYATDPMDLSNFTSLKSLRLFSLDEYFGPPDEGNQNTSLQELVLQSAWTQEASTYKLSQFPNITSLKIVDHHNYDGGKSHLLFPTVPNKKKKNKKKKKTTTTTTDGLDTGGRTSQLPVLSKLQHLEARGDLIIITQSQLKHVTPNLTFLTIGSVSIDNLKEILKSLTPDITELTSEIEIIKAICPSITALGTPPPKILFSGQDISFPVDCKALLSQLDETLKEAEAEDHAYGVWHKERKRDSLM